MIAAMIGRRRCAVAMGLGALALVVGGVPLRGQDGSRGLKPVRVEKKRALLIGNAAYVGASTLKNTIADVKALEGALIDLGFDSVTSEENLTQPEMVATMRAFAGQLGAGDLAFFYFSGHGVQVKTASDGNEGAENYLLPVDFEADTLPSELPDEAYGAGRVQRMLRGSGAKVRVLVLDACRDNPFKTSRSGAGGLAKMEAEGDLIVYSTGAKGVAWDNPQGALGLYMTHLLPELRRDRVELKEAFERTKAAVVEAAKVQGRSQRPAEYNDLIGRVYLRGGLEPPPPPPPPPPGEAEERARELLADAERLMLTADAMETREAKLELLKEVKNRLAGITYGHPGTDTARSLRSGEMVGKISLAGIESRIAALTIGPAGTQEEDRLPPPPPPPDPLRAGEQREYDGMEFVWVPAGEFLMGSESEHADGDEQPVRRVEISAGYYMGKHEVTQGEWEAVMGSNPSYFQNCGEDCPVEQVSWEAVQEFIGKLNAREGARGYSYRLPTEAEWEYAARAGSTADTPSGDLRIPGTNNAPVLDRIAWYGGNSGVSYAGGYDCSEWAEKQYSSSECGPQRVGGKAANAWGLHDMLGNVWEWVEDRYGEYPGGSVTDPAGPSSGSHRVERGGGWISIARDCRSSYRYGVTPGDRYYASGFAF